jgi:hypothetical protein
MRKTILTAVAAFIAGGVVVGAALSQAQPPGPPPGGPNGGHPHGMMGWMQHDRGAEHDRMFKPQDFALVYRAADRNLSPADVQKIAEAFLLFRGNHTWKVTGVGPAADGQIGFSLATAEGSVVAKFTMDPHTGKLNRVG